MRLASALLALSLLALAPIAARGEEKHGVPVYPGARFDAATTTALKESMKLDAGCYRTDDPVAKVAAFYARQPGLKAIGQDAENAMFKKGGADVTVQRPWMDMKSGLMNQDTLITIVKMEK